jgi:hypothetical protein
MLKNVVLYHVNILDLKIGDIVKLESQNGLIDNRPSFDSMLVTDIHIEDNKYQLVEFMRPYALFRYDIVSQEYAKDATYHVEVFEAYAPHRGLNYTVSRYVEDDSR